MTRLIYAPKGRAQEYCELALNLYRGCTHGCTYCYVPGMLRQTREQFHAGCTVRRETILAELEAECAKHPGNDRPVLMCFTSDPFAAPDAHIVTPAACEILHRYGYVPVILTKNPILAAAPPRMAKRLREASVWLGTTFTCIRDAWRVEPNAPTFTSRLSGLMLAHQNGLRTWVSVEPVIDASDILHILNHHHDIADLWKFGRLNHDTNDPTDYQRYTDSLQVILGARLPKLRYYIKDDLSATRSQWNILKERGNGFWRYA